MQKRRKRKIEKKLESEGRTLAKPTVAFRIIFSTAAADSRRFQESSTGSDKKTFFAPSFLRGPGEEEVFPLKGP